MALSPPTSPTAPDLNSPSTYNQRVLDGFTYCFTTLPNWIAGLDANDWFSVQSSVTDNTAGAVLTVGAFGLGNSGSGISVSTDNANDCLVSGMSYSFTAVGANTPETNPYGSSLLVMRGRGGEPRQIYMSRAGDAMWIRGYISGAWTAWKRITVIYGSNANGEYVRLPDGTQICWRSVSIELAIDAAYFGGYRSSAQGQNCAASFVSAPVAFATVKNQTAFGVEITDTSTTGASLRWLSISSQASATREAFVCFIGRWY